MNSAMLAPGAVLGVLGGGQLGAMFAMAARRLGYRVAVWEPDPDAPAHRTADHSFPTVFSDASTMRLFSQTVQAVTYEWENVPADLCHALEQQVIVRPASRILWTIQDRLKQKGFLSARGLPVPSYREITTWQQLEAASELGYPCLCKTAISGYDGKGQWKIDDPQDLAKVQAELRETPLSTRRWIVEEFLAFEREIAVLVVRAHDGAVRVYPPVENIHENGILRMTTVPATLPSKVAEQAVELARRVVEALEGVGIFCVELFVMPDGRVLINEIAPRPHNSGHYTLDACTVSQFEQQVRALCGMPLGEVRLLSPATMVNLIGEDIVWVTGEAGARALLEVPGAILHIYGKRPVRARRKMGHVTFLADGAAAAHDRARRFRDRLVKEGASLTRP